MAKMLRKRRSSRRRIPYGAYKVAQSLGRRLKHQHKLAAIDEAITALTGENNAGQIARQNIVTRRNKRLTAGFGMYTGAGAYKVKVGQFLKRNRTAQMLYDTGMSSAMAYGSGMGQPGMYSGYGEYEPASNALISKSSMDVVPLFSAESDEGIVISKREYVSEIYGPNGTAFSLQSFPLNPGLESSFPWLSQIAQNYDEYDLVQCIFTFKSTTTESTNSANGQVGTVIMATSYNAAAPNFTDKVTMMQYEFANSGRLTESLQHGVECDPAKLSGSRGEYIRNNPVVVGQDLKTYDHGKFQIAIANCAPAYYNQSIGELWVSYTVRLRKSKFYTALGLGISKDLFVSSGGELLTQVMGTNILRGQQNNIGVLLTQPAASTLKFTFPAAYKGTLKIIFAISPAVLAGVISSYTNLNINSETYTGNVVPVADLYGNASNVGEIFDTPSDRILVNNLNTGLFMLKHLSINVATAGVDNTYTIVYGITAAGAQVPSQAYVEISEYNSGFSYTATGVGVSDAPVFINSSGVVTIPN